MRWNPPGKRSTHLGKWGRGRLRLGASTTACQHILPPVLREFKESFPDHAITIEPGDTPEVIQALLQHRIDLALALASDEAQLEFQPLFTDELHFIVARCIPGPKPGRWNVPKFRARTIFCTISTASPSG